MRIAIVDYSGHAFTVELSRNLARRGHTVLHSYFGDFQSPHGRLEKSESDPVELSIQSLSLNQPFQKYSFFRRRLQEISVGKAFAAAISKFDADIIVAGNCPLDVVAKIAGEARRTRKKFVFWQQDIYSNAISRILGDKYGLLGRLIGAYYRNVEGRILRLSDATIAISQDFVETIRQELTLSARNVFVVENWAPLDEIPLRPKHNSWAEAQGLLGKTVVLYCGTIGLKHDPQQLLDLAVGLQDDNNVKLVVVSEGPFAYWLAHQSAIQKLDNVVVLPFQSHLDFPDVLATADIAVAILEKDAGTFSVPSKILSYLCAGRAIVLSAPKRNLASRILERSKSGYAVDAGDRDAFVSCVKTLLIDRGLRDLAGRNARNYAEVTFDIEKITDRFERIFADVLADRTLPSLSTSEHAPGDTANAEIRPHTRSTING